MEEKTFDLDPHEHPRWMNILQIIFGIICIAVAFYNIISGLNNENSSLTLVAAVIFLFLFGIYQIMAGSGNTRKYFRITADRISIRQLPVLPVANLGKSEIEKIEFFPLSIKFHLKNRRKIKFRFGISYPEIIDPVKQYVITFAETNNISFSVLEEDL